MGTYMRKTIISDRYYWKSGTPRRPSMFQQIVKFTNKHKIVRGMISYSVLWPTGSLIEQSLVEHKNFKTYDWKKCLRYSLYGALFSGPTLYLWMRLACIMWPKTDIKSSFYKAITEQFSYDPMAITVFLYGMSRLEGKSHEKAREQVQSKFFETYRIGFVYWPTVQTINFALIPPKNQVVFSSFFSMLWTAFLAYMKHAEIRHVDMEHHLTDIPFLDF